jgi:hypothetical protein
MSRVDATIAPPLPPDLQDVFDQMEAADRAAEAIDTGLSDRQFHWQPDGSRRWSIAQCLDHLTAINMLYADGMRSAVAEARRQGWGRRGPLAPGPFGRFFIRSQEPPVKRRFRTPGKVSPAPGVTRDEVLRQYHAAHDTLRQLVREAAAIDANRATFANPFLKLLRMKVATGLQVLPAHDRRHLWQAGQVRALPDFPAS